MSQTSNQDEKLSPGQGRWKWPVAAVLAVGMVGGTIYAAVAQQTDMEATLSTASSAPSSEPRALPTVDVELIGSMPQADAAVLANADRNWVLASYSFDNQPEPGAAVGMGILLIDSQNQTTYHLLDLTGSRFDNPEVDFNAFESLEWVAGETTASVIWYTDEGANAGTLNLLTGELTDHQLIRGAWVVGLRQDGALVGVAEDGSLRVFVDGKTKRLTSAYEDPRGLNWIGISPDGDMVLRSESDTSFGRFGYQTIDLETGEVQSHVLATDPLCDILGWVSETSIGVSCSASSTTIPDRFYGITDADAPMRMTINVDTGEVTNVTALAAGDEWLVNVEYLSDGNVQASGWPVPQRDEVATWSLQESGAYSCVSHSYVGPWGEDLTDAPVAGSWPLHALGGTDQFTYVASNSGGCEGTPTFGDLEMFNSETGTTVTLVHPEEINGSGGWRIYAATTR